MDRISSIEMAIKNETTEMTYYLKQAHRSSNPVAKLLFTTLAADEQEHMTRLRALHQQLIAEGFWPKTVPLSVAGTNISQSLRRLALSVEPDDTGDPADVAALRNALSFESIAERFYDELALGCTDLAEARFFRFLAGIEREHLLSIKDSLFYLEDPRGWLKAQHRSDT